MSASAVGHVDAHVHLWDTGRFTYPWLADVPALDRPFLPGDLLRDAGERPPSAVVVVEADRTAEQSLDEVRWVRASSSPQLPVAGIVAHLPLGPSTVAHLAEVDAVEAVVGVRRLLQDEPRAFLDVPGLVEGVARLAGRYPFDVCVRRRQLAEATELVRRVPGVTFVLDHLGKPQVRRDEFWSWAADLRRLAALPNVRCKLSGLATEADPDHRSPSDLVPFLRHAIDVFGPSRCMFGSDWPVLTTAMSYRQWLEVVLLAVEDLPGPQQDLVMRGTAEATYLGRVGTGRGRGGL